MQKKKENRNYLERLWRWTVQLQGWGQMWPTGCHGPVGVSNHAGLWTVGSPYFTRPILRCWKKSCETACRSITHVVNLGSHPATLWRRLSLAAYLVHVYHYLPIMTAYHRVLHVKSDENKWHRNPSRRRFAKTDQPNYRSASTFLLKYWCRLWIRLVAFWNPRWKKKCEKTLSQLHIVFFSFESKC